MTWLISKALMDSYEKWPSSQELEEESSEDICMDGEPCAQSSGKPIQLAYLPPDRMTKFSRLSRFGMTFRPLTESRGEDLLMWYREDFLAKTYPQQERAQESPAVNRVCGNTWHELLMKYDPDSHSWKTVRCLFPEELQWSSVTLPTWGMTVNGALFQHQTLVRPISGIGFGSEPNNEKLPTPQATDHISKRTSASWKAKGGVNYSLSNPEIQMMWPTPRSCSAMASTITTETAWNQDRFPNLETIVGRRTWPIPAARERGTTISKNHPNGFNRSLVNDVIKWPTPNTLESLPPTANEDACGKPTGKMQKMLGNHPEVRQDPNGGVLNADWVEWLMGWPIGWTKLEPLESVTEFDETWWDVEPVPRVLIGATARADRLKAIGNGQVPAVAATAWNILRKK